MTKTNSNGTTTGGTSHDPKHRYDCGPCKFSWCCGLTCGCNLSKAEYPPPPDEVKEARLKAFEEETHFITDDATRNEYWKMIQEDR